MAAGEARWTTRWLDVLSEIQQASPDAAIVVLGEEDEIVSKLEPLRGLISSLCPRG